MSRNGAKGKKKDIKKKKKIKENGKDKPVSIEKLMQFADNPYVKDIDTEHGKINYSENFYIVLNHKIENGMKVVDAYNSMGFDTRVLGENRAYKCAQYAKAKADKMKERKPKPEDFDGSVPPEDIINDLTLEELKAYTIARDNYTKVLREVEKKLNSILEASVLSSQNK